MALSIDLSGKVVLVTGVSSGIGQATARQFAKAGARVAGCSRKPADDGGAVRFVQDVQAENTEALYVQADVTVQSDLERMVQAVVDRFGQIDILVSNSGMNVFKGAEGCSEEEWEYNMNLNLASHWRLARLCKPYMEKSGGGVVLLMTSNHAYYTIPGCFPYNVSKTAMKGMVQSMAIEWGPGIRTVGIAPGFIDTAGNDTWFNSFPDPQQERQRTIDMHPVKRIGTTDEVGALCVFLASDYARFISGNTILMDGGRSALMQD